MWPCRTTDGLSTQNLGFGFWKCCGGMGLRKFEQDFSSVFAKFLAYLIKEILKVEHAESAPKLFLNHQIHQNFEKK